MTFTELGLPPELLVALAKQQITEPTAMAITHAHADTASVQTMPPASSCQYVSPPPGNSSKKTPQFQM